MAQDTNTQSTILDRERGFWEAVGDPEFYKANFAEDGLMVLPFQGGLLNKSQVIDTVSKASPWINYTLTEPKFISIGEDCLTLTYKAIGERSNEPKYYAYISSVYVCRSNNWKLLLHQQTPIDNKK